MTLDRACTVYGPPSESAHCFNLGTRGKEEQRAIRSKGTWRRTVEGERQKMGFANLACAAGGISGHE